MEENKIKNPSSNLSNLMDYKEKNKAEKSKKPSKKSLKRVKNNPTDLEHIKKQIFPVHTERGAYNQLCAKVGKRPLNDKEYEQLKRTKRRPDSTYKESKNINMAKNIIRLTESDLHRIVKESVERILREGGRIPADTQIGRHKFKGLKYDKNGNPIYTHPSKLDDPEGGTLSDDDLKAHGWKFSSKHGLHGQIQDPTRLPK